MDSNEDGHIVRTEMDVEECGKLVAGTSVAERKVKFDDHVTYFEFLGDRICLASHSMLEVMEVKIKLVLEMYEILF